MVATGMTRDAPSLTQLMESVDCLAILSGRTITIDCEDSRAAGKLFAALQDMYITAQAVEGVGG